jgi:hypothetical protein
MSIGHDINGEVYGLIDVNVYMSDPQSTLPKSFNAFVKQQAESLCGSDNSIESITCSQKSIEPYTSPKGDVGQKMELTLVHKNLKTGTTTSEIYGPFYVFDTTPTGPREADIPFRYSGVFVYPSFTAFLLDQVISTLELPKQK